MDVPAQVEVASMIVSGLGEKLSFEQMAGEIVFLVKVVCVFFVDEGHDGGKGGVFRAQLQVVMVTHEAVCANFDGIKLMGALEKVEEKYIVTHISENRLLPVSTV